MDSAKELEEIFRVEVDEDISISVEETFGDGSDSFQSHDEGATSSSKAIEVVLIILSICIPISISCMQNSSRAQPTVPIGVETCGK